MRNKIRPSEEKSNRINDIFNNRKYEEMEDLIVNIAESYLQGVLEKEQEEYLGRGHYSHEEKAETIEETRGRRIYRNGYYPRSIRTIEGNLNLAVPRTRNGEENFRSNILENIAEIAKQKLGEIIMETVVRGLSYRDVEECFKDQKGKPIISRNTVTEIMEEVRTEYEEFCKTDLSMYDIIFLFADGVYEPVRGYTNNQTILCCWGVCSNGDKLLLGITAATSENEASWNTFFDDMKNRGLRQPLLVVSDGNKAIKNAIVKSFPLSKRQRCIAHKIRNIMSKTPLSIQSEVKKELHKIYYSEDRSEAETLSKGFIKKYGDQYPSMVSCFNEDVNACLTHLDFPEQLRRFIRTTNLIERSFVEEKRRTKIIPCHQNERGALNLVFAVLIRASYSWRRVKMDDASLVILRNIKKMINPNDTNFDFISLERAA
jgi:putative transposase